MVNSLWGLSLIRSNNGFVLLKIILTHKQIQNTTANSLHHEERPSFTSPDKAFITFANHFHHRKNTSCLLPSFSVFSSLCLYRRTCNLCPRDPNLTQSKVHYIKGKTSPLNITTLLLPLYYIDRVT